MIRCKAPFLVALSCLAAGLSAQGANTVLLPDLFDFRASSARADARLDELDAEAVLQTGLGNPTVASQIQAITAGLRAIRAGAAPLPPGSGFEVHAVSFYEGRRGAGTLIPTATVEVDREGAAVILVLNAYEAIEWTVTATPTTALALVVVTSYEPQVVNVPASAVVLQTSQLVDGDGDYWGVPDDPVENEARFQANAWSIERLGAALTTCVGDYRAPSVPYVVGPANQTWLDQWVAGEAVREGQLRNVVSRAQLVASLQGEFFLPLLTPPGDPFGVPPPGLPQVALATPLGLVQPLAVLPAGTNAYAIGPGGYVLGLGATGPGLFDFVSPTLLPLPAAPPSTPFSFANTMAYDSLRNRLLVSSFGGGGVLYSGSATTLQWSELANPNVDAPSALAYHPGLDALFGLRIDPFAAEPYVLQRYDVSGQIVQRLPLALPMVDYYGEPQQLLPLGNRLAYVGPGRAKLGLVVRHCFVIEPLTGNIDFAGVLLQ